jgi:hypothetical protein
MLRDLKLAVTDRDLLARGDLDVAGHWHVSQVLFQRARGEPRLEPADVLVVRMLR